MATLTADQAVTDIRSMLLESDLASALSGGVYRQGNRPPDSRSEDAVVIFTAGLSGQIHTGEITINIYVPDIDPYGSGVLVKDGERISELQALAQAWVDDMVPGVYLIRLGGMIHDQQDTDIGQTFIVIPLSFRWCGEEA